MRPLEGDLGHSPVSITIHTKIALIAQVPISLIQKVSPEEGMYVLCTEIFHSRDFEPFH